MKLIDVQLGGHYMCRVSGGLVEVEVIARFEKPRVAFRVRRVDGNRAVLPKSRSAAALRPLRPLTCSAMAIRPEPGVLAELERQGSITPPTAPAEEPAATTEDGGAQGTPST
jgi:hypothetical protein